MKHLRIYEEFTTNDIHVGDYVIMNYNGSKHFGSYYTENDIEFENFINNNIGIVVNVNKAFDNIKIEYDNISRNISYKFYKNTIMINPMFVKYVGKTPEDIKLQIKMKKYNI